MLLQENSPKCPRGLFLFEKILLLNSASPYKEGPVLSHSLPLQLDWGLSGSGPHMAQLSTLPSWGPQSLWVYHFFLIPLPTTSSNQVSLGAAQALFLSGIFEILYVQYHVICNKDSFTSSFQFGCLSKWIKDLSVRPETIKIIEENISIEISDIARSNFLSAVSPQATTSKRKNK